MDGLFLLGALALWGEVALLARGFVALEPQSASFQPGVKK